MSKKKTKPKTIVMYSCFHANERYFDDAYLVKNEKDALRTAKDNSYDEVASIVYKVTLIPIKKISRTVTEEKI